MATHKIHLAIAKQINTKLNMDLDEVMLGSVLPDLVISDRDIAHYQRLGTYETELANPDLFIKEYKNELNNPIMIGYLLHLLTDRFYNDYFFKNHCIFNDKGIPIKLRLKNDKIVDDIKNPKHSDFFKYDKYLLKHGFIEKFNNLDCINNVKDFRVAKFDKNKLKNYIISSNKDKPKDLKTAWFYKVLNKKELDKIFNDCIKYVLDYLEKI